MPLFQCSVGGGGTDTNKIVLPLFQAAQTRRSDADNSKAILTLYNDSGFKSMTGLFQVKSSVGVFNGATIAVFVSNDDVSWQNIFNKNTNTNNYSEQVTVNLSNKKYLKLILKYQNQYGDESDNYGAFLLNTTITINTI